MLSDSDKGECQQHVICKDIITNDQGDVKESELPASKIIGQLGHHPSTAIVSLQACPVGLDFRPESATIEVHVFRLGFAEAEIVLPVVLIPSFVKHPDRLVSNVDSDDVSRLSPHNPPRPLIIVTGCFHVDSTQRDKSMVG